MPRRVHPPLAQVGSGVDELAHGHADGEWRKVVRTQQEGDHELHSDPGARCGGHRRHDAADQGSHRRAEHQREERLRRRARGRCWRTPARARAIAAHGAKNQYRTAPRMSDRTTVASASRAEADDQPARAADALGPRQAEGPRLELTAQQRRAHEHADERGQEEQEAPRQIADRPVVVGEQRELGGRARRRPCAAPGACRRRGASECRRRARARRCRRPRTRRR